MKWFGEAWNDCCCRAEDYVRTPTDEACLFCPHPIARSDQGVLMPHVQADASVSVTPVHLDCLLSILGLPSSSPREHHPHPPMTSAVDEWSVSAEHVRKMREKKP